MKRIAFLAIILSLVSSVKAQNGEILYTNFEPDTCLCNPSYTYWKSIEVDINQDGVVDFGTMFYIVSGDVTYLHVKINHNWECRLKNDQDYNDTIIPGDNYQWYSSTGNWTIVNFPNNTTHIDRIYGLRMKIEDKYYYAWLRFYANRILNNLASPTGCIDAYAYCTIPDYPLRWGQTSLDDDIAEHYAANIMVYPNPTTGIINVSGENIAAIEVVNIMGQTMLKKNCDGDEANVDISSFTPGIYFVKAGMNDGNEFSEKIIKE